MAGNLESYKAEFGLGSCSTSILNDELIIEFDPPLKLGEQRYFKGDLGITEVFIKEDQNTYKVFISNDKNGNFKLVDTEENIYNLECYYSAEHNTEIKNSKDPGLKMIKFKPRQENDTLKISPFEYSDSQIVSQGVNIWKPLEYGSIIDLQGSNFILKEEDEEIDEKSKNIFKLLKSKKKILIRKIFPDIFHKGLNDLKSTKKGLTPTYADMKIMIAIYELESELNNKFNNINNSGSDNEVNTNIKTKVEELIKNLKKIVNQYRYYFDGTKEDKSYLEFLNQDFIHVFNNFSFQIKRLEKEANENFSKDITIFRDKIYQIIERAKNELGKKFDKIYEKLKEDLKNSGVNVEERESNLNSLINKYQALFFTSFSKKMKSIIEEYSEYNFDAPNDEQKALGDFAFLIKSGATLPPSLIYLTDLNTLIQVNFKLTHKNTKPKEEEEKKTQRSEAQKKTEKQSNSEGKKSVPQKGKNDNNKSNKDDKNKNKKDNKDKKGGKKFTGTWNGENKESKKMVIQLNKYKIDKFDEEDDKFKLIGSVGISNQVTKMAVSKSGNIIALTRTSAEENLFTVFLKTKQGYYYIYNFISERTTNFLFIADIKKDLLPKLSLESENGTTSNSTPSDLETPKRKKNSKKKSAITPMKSNTGISSKPEVPANENKELNNETSETESESFIFEAGEDLLLNIYKHDKTKDEVVYVKLAEIDQERLPEAKSIHSILYVPDSLILIIGANNGILIKLENFLLDDFTTESTKTKINDHIKYLASLKIKDKNYIVASDGKSISIVNVDDKMSDMKSEKLKEGEEVCFLKAMQDSVTLGVRFENKLSLYILTEHFNPIESGIINEHNCRTFSIGSEEFEIDVIEQNKEEYDEKGKSKKSEEQSKENVLVLLLTDNSKNLRIYEIDKKIPEDQKMETLEDYECYLNLNRQEKWARKKSSSICFENNTMVYLYEDGTLKKIKLENKNIKKAFYKLNFEIGKIDKAKQLEFYLRKLDKAEMPLLVSYYGLGHSAGCTNQNCNLVSRKLLDFKTKFEFEKQTYLNKLEESNQIKTSVDKSASDQMKVLIDIPNLIEISNLMKEFIDFLNKECRISELKQEEFCNDIWDLIKKFRNLLSVNDKNSEELETIIKNKNQNDPNLKKFESIITNHLRLVEESLTNFYKSQSENRKKIYSILKNDQMEENKINCILEDKNLDFEGFYSYIFNEKEANLKIYFLNGKFAVLTCHMFLFVFNDNDDKNPKQVNLLERISLYQTFGELELGYLEGENLFLINSINQGITIHFFNLDKKNDQDEKNVENIKLIGELTVFCSKKNLIVLAFKTHELILLRLGSETNQKKFFPHCAEITCLAISNDGKFVASGSEDESLKVFDAYAGLEKNTIRYKSGDVIGLAFLQNHHYIAASYRLAHGNNIDEYKLYIFSLEKEECMINIGFKSTIPLSDHPFKYLSVSKENEILTNDSNQDLAWIDNHVTKSKNVLPAPQLINSIYLSKYRNQNKDKKENFKECYICAFGGVPGNLQFLNPVSISTVEASDGTIYCICMSQNIDKNLKIAVGYQDGHIMIFKQSDQYSNDQLKLERFYEYSDGSESVNSMSFSSDDSILFCGLENAEIIAFKIETNSVKRLIRCKMHKKGVITDLKFTPINGCYELISGGYDKRLNLSNLDFGKNNTVSIEKIIKIKEFKIHKGAIYCVAWSSDGKRFLSGGEDKVIIVYDRESLSILRTIKNHSGSVWNAEFITSANGNQIISSGEDKVLIVSDVLTSQLIHRLAVNTGSHIWDFVYNEEQDKVIAANDQGLFELFPFENTNSRMIHYRNILQKKDIPVKFPDDLNVLPHPFQMNRLQYSIGMNEIKYIDDLLSYFKKKSDKADSEFNHIYSLLYNPDWDQKDSWDYSETYAASNRNRIQRILIDLHLMMGERCYRSLNLVKNNVKILEITKKFFPEKLLDVFETFFSVPFYFPIMKDLVRKDAYILNSCYPTNEIVYQTLNPKRHGDGPYCKSWQSPANAKQKETDQSNNQGEEFRIIYAFDISESTGDEYYNQETIEIMVITFQVVFRDFPRFLKVIDGMDVEDDIFGSDNLLRVVHFYWDLKYKSWFYISLVQFIIFLVITTLLILRTFVKRSDECKTECPTSLSNESYFYLIIVLGSLAFFILREILQFSYQKGETLWAKALNHFKSLWNIIDLIMIFTGICSVFLDFKCGPGIVKSEDVPLDELKYLYSIFFFFSWMRLLEFARGFESLSFLIRLLAKVTVDMFGFLIVLGYMIIGFGLMSFLVQSYYHEHTYSEFIRIFYMVLLGQYDWFFEMKPNTHLNEKYSFFIVFVVSIIMVILMLNLLIALISESHQRVMAIEKQASIYEKLDLINGMSFIDKGRDFIKRLIRNKEKSDIKKAENNQMSFPNHKNESVSDDDKYCSFLILKRKESFNEKKIQTKIDSIISKLDIQGEKIGSIYPNQKSEKLLLEHNGEHKIKKKGVISTSLIEEITKKIKILGSLNKSDDSRTVQNTDK